MMDWDEEERILFDLLIDELADAAQYGGRAVIDKLRSFGGLNMQVDWLQVNEAGRDWAAAYVGELVKQITQTTKEQVRNAVAAFHATPGMTRNELERLLVQGSDGIQNLILPNGRVIPANRRAEMIAVTEITRSYSAGEVASMNALDVEQVRPLEQPPAHVGCRCDISPFTREDGVISWKWLTLNDGLVCKICQPLHGKDVGAASQKVKEPIPATTQPKPVRKPRTERVTQPKPIPSATTKEPKPVGSAVSQLFKTEVSERTQVGKVINHTLKTIDKVHGVDRVPGQIVIKQTYGERRVGVYRSYLGKPLDIGVSVKGTHRELTLAHEIGHAIDHQMLDIAGRYASQTSTKLSAWRNAVKESRAFKALRESLNAQPEFREIPTPHGVIRQRIETVNKQWVRYATQTEELFARSYSQYIAEVSGDPLMLEQVQAVITKTTYAKHELWDADDFALIRKAFDELFESLGWRK